MGKFQLRKPKIISKNFPEVGSHIDNVSTSLHDLVFSYSEQVDKALQKKHMMMALSSLVLVLVVGSFISPKGKADIATFYPETCLGGWNNPRNAEGEPETSSNGDPSQFHDKNSAILDKNTSADIYCGNFNGTFNDATTPKKIVVSFAITNKEEITAAQVSSTTENLLQVASDTLVGVTTTEQLVLASSSENISGGGSASDMLATTTGETVVDEAVIIATTTEKVGSFVDILVDSVAEVLGNLLDGGVPVSDTDTVIIPTPVVDPPAPVEVVPQVAQPEIVPPEESAPTSFLDVLLQNIATAFAATVFAEEVITESETVSNTLAQPAASQEIVSGSEATDPPLSQAVESVVTVADKEAVVTISTTSEDVVTDTNATTSIDLVTVVSSSTDSLVLVASSTAASTTEITLISNASSTSIEEVDSQNNFLEILYTFDGLTWVSLGELNEISMKYRTFDIPLSASSTWSDMSQLQIKVTTKSLDRETPVTYLDGIKVEVLYESSLEYSHPDFARDTILTDETIDGMRIVNIINNENNEEETWYMYLDEEVLVEASSSVLIATSTPDSIATTTHLGDSSSSSLALVVEDTQSVSEIIASTTDIMATSTNATTSVATSTIEEVPIITPVILKNKWFKLEKKEAWATLSPKDLVKEIKKSDQEEMEEEKKEDRLPDFALDFIRKIKGAFFNAVIVQVVKDGQEELWLYDLENGNQSKIEVATSTPITIAKDMQLGLKDHHLFWLSEDRLKVYAYNLSDKSIKEAEIPAYASSTGERGVVRFDGIVWDVIIGSEDFAFYSEATGEVFSDDNGNLSEILRQKLELDKVLDVGAISDLNFSVTATGTIEE